MAALGHIYIKCSAHKMAERDLAKRNQHPGECLEEYGKVQANLARKAFLDNAGEESKQLFGQLEYGLVYPYLSSQYLDYCSAHPKSSIIEVLDYIQEHEEI